MRIEEVGGPSKYRAVILTALPVEYRAVRAHLSDLVEEVHEQGSVYERGCFSSGNGVWEVLLAEVSVGNPRAAFETERALHYFKPHVALFVGVAGGLKDVSIGDVVFAPKVYFYESGKVLTGFEPRPDAGESSYALEQRARAEARRERWQQRLIGPAPGRVPRALAGPLAAGEKVLAETRSALYQFLRAQYGDALAVEMEGRGFLMAARTHRRVESLVIRGISDRIDAKGEADAAGSQELASRHAGAFAFELLAQFIPSSEELALPQLREEEHGLTWSVPYSRNPNFTGRDEFLQDLRAHFVSDSSPRPLALYGLGGVGKTQLAVEYAIRHAHDEHNYAHVLWLRADEPSVLASSYAGLADVLELPENAEKEQSHKLAAVRRWLQEHEGWLLIFDNAEQPGALIPYLPPTFKGHILITSRNPAWAHLAKPCSVEMLSPAASVEFLHKRTGQDDPTAAMLLALALGGLPLALAQAAAYIEQTGKALADYLQLFEARRKELLERPGAPADYPHTVAATWSLSFEQIQAQMPEGAALLSLCAFLAPSPIPIALLRAGSDLLPGPLSSAVTNEVRLDELVATLRRYSLVQVHQQHLLFHTLVQAVMRGRLAVGGGPWARAAVGLMHRFFVFESHDMKTWPRCATLFPHAHEAASHAWELKTGLELLPELLVHLGQFWEGQAEYAFAQHVLGWGLAVLQQSPSPSPFHEVQLRHCLGVVALASGSLNEAEEHLKHAQTLLHSFPEAAGQTEGSAILLGHLAKLAARRGRFHEARAQAEKALSLLESNVKGDHPLIGHAASTLGSILEQQADFVQARVHAERALGISRAHFGLVHPTTASDLHHLGGVLEALGRYSEAKEHQEQALTITEALYGPEHPRVSAVLRALGTLHQRLGNLKEAQVCCERGLRIDEARLGPEHMNVAVDLNNIARVRHAQGDLTGARAFQERALILYERAFGLEHPDLATGLDNLGRIQQVQGELEQARASFTRALAMHERIYGLEHPRVANVLNNLGVLLMEMKDLFQARLHLERAVAIDEKSYGLNHPEVATDLANLAALLIKQGEKEQGRERLQRALSIYDSHAELPASESLACAIVLGKVHYEIREWASARSYLERAMLLQERCPPDEPQRFELLLLLGSSLRHLKEYAQAVTLLEQARARPAEGRDPRQICDLLLLLGICYRELKQADLSGSNLTASRRIAEEEGYGDLLSHVQFEQGRLARQQQDLQTAKRLIEQVWEQRSEVELERPDTVLIELGLIQEALEDQTGACARFEEAMRFAESIRGPDSPAVATCATHLGRVLSRCGTPAEARPHLERALTIRERTVGPSSLRVAQTLLYLAEAEFLSKQFQEAERAASQAFSIYCASQDPPAHELFEVLIVLGGLHQRAGALKEAQAEFERALSLQDSIPGKKEFQLVFLLSLLGKVYALQRAPSRAKPTLERALRGLASSPTPQPLQELDMTRRLGDLCKEVGDLSGARTYFARTVEFHESLPTPDPVPLAVDRFKLANVLRTLGEQARALRLTEQALSVLQKEPHAEDLASQAFMLRGELLLAINDWQQARSSFEQALEKVPEGALPPGLMSNLHNNLGLALRNLGLSKRALLHFERALPLAAKSHGTVHPEYALVLANIGMLLAQTGNRGEAVKKLKRALAIFEQQDGPEHPATAVVRQELEVLSR
jgi:tetratricopeptide (TPR) repeat protein